MTIATLIAGPTASGKSGLAFTLAKRSNRLIINADSLQVYDGWRVLSARPSIQEETEIQHALYGHIAMKVSYSVGQWLRDLKQTLDQSEKKPIIVGGTGLYFRALTEGLAEIPNIPDNIRDLGNKQREDVGIEWFKSALLISDNTPLKGIDENNPARVQRAWEVWETTGIPMWQWHKNMPPPLIPIDSCQKIVLNWQPSDLNERIDQRFDIMMATGAIEEVEKALEVGFNPALPSGKALGAREITAALKGEISMATAVTQSKIATHQFAKRQRTWFRNKMKTWTHIEMSNGVTPENILANLIT